MECLTDLVGIKKTCETPVSKSGLWLQNLPGFSLKLADAAVNEETISGLQLIKDKYIHAQNQIVAQFRNQFQDKIRSASVLTNQVVGYYPSRQKTISSDNSYLKGVKIEIQDQSYLEVFISQIGLMFKDTVADTEIFIYDLFTGKLLDTYTVDTVAGAPTYVNINKAYATNRQRLSLFICYNAGLSDTYESNVYQTRSGCASCNGQGNNYAYVSGAKIDKSLQKISSNTSSTTGTSGMTISYSLNCSVDSFLCSIAGRLAWPLLYKWGAEIMAELQYSRRLNSIITIDRDLNETLRQEYENEYMSSMGALINNIQLPSDVCFTCNSRIKKTVAIP